MKLDIMKTIKDGVKYGLNNFLPLLCTVILYLLTCWIPYLNVGTTIGFYRIVIGIGRNQHIDPVSIFNKDNFQNLSGFFLLQGLVLVGTIAAAVFMLLPALIVGIAWGFAVYFYLDKGVSPLKSLQLSYDTTYGNKWRIFAVVLLACLAMSVVSALVALIPEVGKILSVVVSLLFSAVVVAINGVMYDFFSKKADSVLSGTQAEA
ncbi:MAG: hypothetical protein IJS02_04775 [Bacteroidales bacterium]|nr:hypothetical protein [Bacteroidales bacterium]